MTVRPSPIGITMGEPSGIGPELIVRLWQNRKENAAPVFIYIGTIKALEALPDTPPYQLIIDVNEAGAVFPKALPVIEIPSNIDITLGTPKQETGSTVIAAIDTAVEMAAAGKISAVVTAPIHKAALYKAGFDCPGHTEYLSRKCGLDDSESVMMLVAQDLRVVPVTVHVALKDVPSKLTTSDIVHAATITHNDLQSRFGIPSPQIAIAALNPHAGEGGTMGLEEATHILPAVWELTDNGISVTEPLPADTLFHEDARKRYDAVICMYHDQALIPLKTLDFWGGVNITLGLPIIRTSPDHGTALELAGQNKARVDSMLAAVLKAQLLSKAALAETAAENTSE